MTQNNSHDRDEERLAQLLRTVDADVPAPDRERLNALREQSAELFVGRALLPVSATSQPEDGQECPSYMAANRSSPMLAFALRGLAGLTASALSLVLVVWLMTSAPTPVSGAVAFSEVLAELRGAETLQFRLFQSEGLRADVWVRAPGLVRKEESPQRYEIAAGSQLWRVDETANTVTEGDSPWFLRHDKQIDLVGLLGVDVSDSSGLLTAKPVTRQLGAHGDEFVYLATVPSKHGTVTIEAVANASTKRLTHMSVWEGVRDFKQWKWLRDNAERLELMPPLADLTLVAVNVPVADDKFVVAKSLTEDGRIGKVSDAQGIVVLRPMLAKRWTPVCREMLLKPGDWVRTELRGANAIKVTLSSEVELTLGPGTLIECMSPTKARLHTGQVQVRSRLAPRDEPNASPVPNSENASEEAERQKRSARLAERDGYVLLAPRDGSRVFKPNEKKLVRVDRDEKLVDVEKTPLWLAGFEGTSNNESLGSLIVNLPDGRNEPLTVGYHKVSVEIRDQIARTTIEESFVNHTDSRLEGVFHFPLPQEASISGFGMWIGNDLVEADVVEKQRAREIYETILREKRDPGLLEWTGGNIFKARVFPIEAHSEKRIKIVYTQVLPLRANRYRYSYGLRSELLRTKPLRELSLNVTVNSALPLKSVTCPTHTARVVGWPPSAVSGEVDARTQDGRGRPSYNVSHSAQVEFAAQEYTPTRDFEVVCEIDGRQSDVVVVPHRRGDDGYLLVQLSPPAPDGNWQREVLPDGKPLNVVLLCDTSASMDSEKRKQQTEFVSTVLASLGDADRFQLTAADVGTVWAFAEPVAANAENVAKARAFLDERLSLGWTNLDRAFEDVLKKAPAEAHVIYIGDGVVSSGDTDPAAFVKRLAALRSRLAPRDEPNASPTPTSANDSDKAEREKRSARHAERDGYVHAIGVGNSFESVVLKGVAAVGGGSVRNIGGEQTPQIVANELLNEIAQPGLRDLNVEFRGLRVAAVYPERLPNVAAGTQQILVGRYLPDGRDQFGEIIVTGMRGSEKVRYAARVSLKDAEAGNSFIPRLWARAHLDQLLAQGQNQAIRDEIIRLSEEFHIITPFTSLLVLETDADRERFGVQRRYEMRDGERFFAEGRDNANYELLQQQMKRAGDWRLGLRREVLRSLAGLGRNPRAIQQQVQAMQQQGQVLESWRRSSGWIQDGVVSWNMRNMLSESDGPSSTYLLSEHRSRGFLGRFDNEELNFNRLGDVSRDVSTPFDQPLDAQDTSLLFGQNGMESALSEFDSKSVEDLSLGLQDSEDDRKSLRAIDALSDGAKGGDVRDELLGADFAPMEKQVARSFSGLPGLEAASRPESFGGERSYFGRGSSLSRRGMGGGGYGGAYWNGGFSGSDFFAFAGTQQSQPAYTSWLYTLFPAVNPAPRKTVPAKVSQAWPPEAIALSKSLQRTESLLKLDGGIELRRVTDRFDPRWKQRLSRDSDLLLYSPSAWLHRTLDLADQTLIEFCDAKERGVYSLSFLLGQVRASVDQELKTLPVDDLADYSLSPALHESSGDRPVRLEPAGENQVRMIIVSGLPGHESHIKIDTAKHVVLKSESFEDGRLMGTRTFSDFVEVGGSWWGTKSVATDAKGRTTSETKLVIQSLGKEPFGQRISAELTARPTVQFLHRPFVKLKVARQKVADGSANFDDRMAMILHNFSIQQWDEMWKQVEAAEKLAADKPGVRWLRTILLGTIRRNEEARQRLLTEAKQLAAKPQQDETFLAQFILGQAHSLMGWPEYFEFVQLFEAANKVTRSVSEGERSNKPGLDDDKTTTDRESKERAPSLTLRVTSRFDRDRLQEARLQCLDALARHEEALALRRTMAEQAPWERVWQTDYANRLAQAGQVDAALAWLQKELDRPAERESNDDETLHNAIARLYHAHGRWSDLLKFTTEWIGQKLASSSHQTAYAEHLAALIYNDQVDAANALVEQWFREARIDGPLAPDQRARLETAIQFANGQCYHLSFQRPDERWFEQLAETTRFFLRHKHHADIATRHAGNSYFLQSEIADRLRGEFLSLLQTDLPKLTPTQINALLGWVTGRIELREPLNGRKQLDATEITDNVWKKIATELKPRWVAEQDKDQKHLLSEALRTISLRRLADEDNGHLPFLRERLAVAHPDYKIAYVWSLFETLLTVNWSDAIEQEAFARLLDLSDADEVADRLAVQVPALHRLVDAMLANRQSLAESQLGDRGEQNKLTRKELAAKKAEFRKTAREQVAARLGEQAGILLLQKRVPNADDLARWMRIEQAWLDVSLDQKLPQVEELCWQILGEVPNVGHVSNVPEDEDEHVENVLHDPQVRQQFFEELLKQRAFTTVMNLAARRNAAPATINRVLKYIDAGIDRSRTRQSAGDPRTEDPRSGERGYDAGVWRNAKFRMLIALDRPDDLDRELREWIRTDVSTAPWRQMLAKLVAERGKLDEAIQLFEACEKDKLLTNSDFQMLANWYLVSNRRAAYERSRIEAFKQMPEHQLSNRLASTANRWMQPNGQLPSELGEDTLFVAQALFEKSAQPEQHLWQHSNLYGATRDFRLLRMLPDAVLGRTPQQVYSFVQTLQSAALGELRNEAPADEILTRIKQLRSGVQASGAASAPRLSLPNANDRGADAAPLAKTLTTTDLRALDLLEAIVERKSSEVLNQPGPHVDACVAALQRAFQREWSDGEPRMMSTFLYQLGNLPNATLKAEQLREMRELQRRAPANSRDHLAITSELCHLMFWNYGQRHDALLEMEVVVTNYTQANNGVWPHLDYEWLDQYVAMLEGSSHHDIGEKLLKRYLAKPDNDGQRNWLKDRLMTLYNNALEADVAVSLGKGRAKLFEAIVALTRKELAAASDEHMRHKLIVQLLTTFDIARRHQLPATAATVRTFVFEELPVLLKRQQSQYRSTVVAPMHLIGEVLGPKLALQYVVERMEQYPQRLEFSWENSWQTFGHELARRRHDSEQAKLDIKELEPRVLKLTIAELKRELRTGEGRDYHIYRKHSGYFWPQKGPDFAQAAEDVLAQRRTSGRRAFTVATYLWDGLDRGARAIEILLVAHKEGLLEESAQAQLVNWLHQQNRWAESIPLLELLVRDRLDNIHYRTQLMIAYHHSQRPEQLAALYHQIDTHFHTGGRWTEGNVAQFARGCSSCNMHERAASLFNEAIALHQRGNPRSGLNDSTLSDLYQNLALSQSALGHTKEAVDAASAAIVCWGPRNNHRGSDLGNLNHVLASAKDLNEFVAHLDAESAKTGQDSPILRKAIGQTYQARKEYAKAIAQLQLAAELQPHDQEVHQALIACYDVTQSAAAASKQLLKLIDLHRHELTLYQQLAERLKDNEAEAERAATSIIESNPNESESHTAMAELRQKQNRWSEAIPHWQQVSELRRLEPTGLLKLTEAQIHEKLWGEARKSIEKLQKTEWPARFSDVTNQTRRLQELLPK